MRMPGRPWRWRSGAERGIPLLVHASSMGVYGDVAESPVAETTVPRPISFYGASKLAAEHALAIAPGVRGISLRMFSIYGPGQDLAEMRQGMVSIFLAMAIAGAPIEVRGPLERVRDFVFIDDCVEAWLRALGSREASGPFNVGTGVGTSIQALLTQMLELLGLPDHPEESSRRVRPGTSLRCRRTPSTPSRRSAGALAPSSGRGWRRC